MKDGATKPGHLVRGMVHLDQKAGTSAALSKENRRVQALKKLAQPVNLGWKAPHGSK